MSKGIHTDKDDSVWAVIFNSHSGGLETYICESEESAKVFAWFNASKYQRPHIEEMPLIRAEVWRNDRHDEDFTDEGITVRRRPPH